MRIEISIDVDFKAELEFLKRELERDCGIMGSRAFFEVEDSEISEYEPIIEEIILTSFKYRYFYNEVKDKITELADIAILFSIVDFDGYRERQKVYALCKSREICIDGIYNFSLQELRDEWDKLIELLKEFYTHNPTFNEKCELVSYMIQGFKSCYKRVKYYVDSDKDVTDLQKVIYYHEKIDLSLCSDNVRSLFSSVYN